MESSDFFNTVDRDSMQEGFPYSTGNVWDDLPELKPLFVDSPVQLPRPLADPDPSPSWSQPSPSIYSHAHEPLQSASFAQVCPDPGVPNRFDSLGRSFQIERHTVQYYPRFFNPQGIESTPTVMQTTGQPSAIPNAGRPSMHTSLQGYPPTITNGSLPVQDPFYAVQDNVYPSSNTVSRVQSHYNASVDQSYAYIQPSFSDVPGSSPLVPPDLVPQPMVSRFPTPTRRNSRGNRSSTNSPYRPSRTSSLPVQSVSPREMVVQTCKWLMDDGTICGAEVTYGSVPQHLVTHGIENKPHDFRLSCGWRGCRIKGDKAEMRRESIVRHVRETHLGYRRSL